MSPSESPPAAQSPPPDADPETAPSRGASLANVGFSLLLSALVLAIIAYFTFDAGAFRDVVAHLRPLLLLAAVGVAVARIGVSGWRLSYVSQGRLSLRSGTRGQLAWDFFSSVTPSIVGGGPIAAFYVARDQNITVGESAAFMFFCILLDQLWFVVAIPILIGANAVVDLLPEAAGAVGMWGLMAYFGGLLAWAAVYAYATLFRPRLLLRLAEWCVEWPYLRRARERVLDEMRSYVRRARTLGAQSPGFYVNGFLLTGLSWLARYGLVALIVLSVYAEADALSLVVRSAAMMLVGLIMPTPGGSGGLEGLYALFVGPLIPASLVAPTLLTWRLLSYYLFIALGAYLFMHQLRDPSSPDSAPSPVPPPEDGKDDVPPPVRIETASSELEGPWRAACAPTRTMAASGTEPPSHRNHDVLPSRSRLSFVVALPSPPLRPALRSLLAALVLATGILGCRQFGDARSGPPPDSVTVLWADPAVCEGTRADTIRRSSRSRSGP